MWLPDNLLLLQEYFPVDAANGIVRMEFLGKKLLYAMRVASNGAFNLCPSEACNPEGGAESHCVTLEQAPPKPVEFYPYSDRQGPDCTYGPCLRLRRRTPSNDTERLLTGEYQAKRA